VTLPVCRVDTPVVEVIKQLDRSGATRAVIVTPPPSDAYVCQISPNEIRRQLLTGLAADSPVGTVVAPSPLFLRESELADSVRRSAVVVELQAAGYSHCAIVSADGRFLRLVRCEELLGTTGGGAAEAARHLRRVLVIGGAGYLGAVLVAELLGAGYAVRVLDNFLYGRGALASLPPSDRIEVAEGDIRNIQTIVSALADVDAVVLLAAVVGDPASQTRPTQTIETNLLAAQAIAFACRSQQINRFLYASTCSVYGQGDGLLTEQSALAPVSLYARTKIASEQSILALGDGTFSPTILRLGTLYGLSPRMRFDLVVNTMTMKAFVDRKITVFGGAQWRPLLHVRDAARAFVACLEAPLEAVGGAVFNVGSEEQNYQIAEIARLISDALGEIPITRQGSTLDARDYRVSFRRLRDVLGVTPRHTVAEAAREIYGCLSAGRIRNPLARVYFNHYFDSTEE
jgi:nucleoside-diphosphate-sugar epimerase